MVGALTVDVRSEMVGKVWSVSATVGDAIEAGDELLTLESMKMEIPIVAPLSGVIAAVHVAEGQVIAPGDLLASIGDAVSPRTRG